MRVDNQPMLSCSAHLSVLAKLCLGESVVHVHGSPLPLSALLVASLEYWQTFPCLSIMAAPNMDLNVVKLPVMVILLV